MYKFYLDEVLLPVTPSSITTTINNKNETLDLMSGDEINIANKPGLTDFEFDFQLPLVNYPTYAIDTKGQVINPKKYLDHIEKLKKEQTPFQFVITRQYGTKKLWYTNTTVVIEEYTIKEDAEEGDTIIVSIKLKQYRKYETQKIKVKIENYKPKIASKKKTGSRSKTSSKGAKKKLTAGCTVIVNGQLHVDSYGNGPGQWRRNWKGKISWFNWKGSHPVHVTTMSGGWQGWVKADEVRRID